MIKITTPKSKKFDKQECGSIVEPKQQTINFLLAFAAVYPTNNEAKSHVVSRMCN